MSTSHNTHCLNCGSTLDKAFCGDCGQPASTHRYSIKSFLSHDLIHSLWHVDKNIFRTLWEIMVRPGTTARTNIAGARARYFPVVTLLLLLTGTYLFVLHNEVTLADVGSIMIGKWDLTGFILHNQKWIFLSFIPIMAASSWIVFRRTHYNYAEHLIVLTHFFAGVLAWACLSSFIPETLPLWLEILINLAWTGFWLIAFWQAFKMPYKTIAGWAWRVLAFTAFFLLLFVILLFIILLLSRHMKAISGFNFQV